VCDKKKNQQACSVSKTLGVKVENQIKKVSDYLCNGYKITDSWMLTNGIYLILTRENCSITMRITLGGVV